jgi:origin recognition complex subunit 2
VVVLEKMRAEHRPNGATPKKDSLLKTLFSTPVKENGATEADTPRIERNADHSARRKSTRTLIERTILGTTSDNDEEEEEIAEEIYNSEEEGIVDEDGLGLLAELAEDENTPATPSKRGRKKGSKNKQKSPTPPPQDLTPHEKYFYQNRGGRVKTSNNTLSSLALLDHEEYFSRARNLVDPHARDIEYLEDLHAESFNQWHFELSQDFNICLYGWGSKKSSAYEVRRSYLPSSERSHQGEDSGGQWLCS